MFNAFKKDYNEIKTTIIVNGIYDLYLIDISVIFSRGLTHEQVVKDVKTHMTSMSFKIKTKTDSGVFHCIDISLTNGLDFAVLNKLEYNKTCNISETLNPGDGTRNMLYTALNVVAYFCPWVKYFEFNDASEKTCIENDKSTGVSLLQYYIALYGKTWYQHVLNARFEDDIKHSKYIEALKKLDNKEFKMSWNEFVKYSGIHTGNNGIHTINKNYGLLERYYSITETYKEYFKLLRCMLEKEELCMTLRPWISTFINKFIFNGHYDIFDKWIFYITDVPKVAFHKPWKIHKEELSNSNFERMIKHIKTEKSLKHYFVMEQK